MKQNLFTPREVQVLQTMLGFEGSVQKTAEDLRISPHTVRVHMRNCAVKLGTTGDGRTATLVRALNDGYIKL